MFIAYTFIWQFYDRKQRNNFVFLYLVQGVSSNEI